MKRFWKTFLAYFRLSPTAVCEMSKGLTGNDYHDYTDSVEGKPWHMANLHCKRCGKVFTI